MNTILVVDDEPNYLIVISELLKEEGFEVLTAERGEEGLDIVTETDLDLILTDMRMPGMGGLEFLKAIKNYNKDLPVIMITAFGEVEKAVVAMKAGAYNYLAKPFNNEELLVECENPGLTGYYLNKAILEKNLENILEVNVESEGRYMTLIIYGEKT